MSNRSHGLTLLVAALVACTGNRAGETADASVAPVSKPATAAEIVRDIAVHPELRIGRSSLLVNRDRGYGLRPVKAFGSSVASLDVTLPLTADGVIRLEDPSRASFTVDLRSDLHHASGEPRDGALVFPGAAPDTDVVQVLEPGRFEELRVLRSPRAGASASWHVTIGKGVASIYVRGNVVEAYDAEGRVRLRTEPAFALDAKGVRRDVTLTLDEHDGDRVLTARFDDKGLEYPIVLDPTWYQAVAVMPNAAFYDLPWLTLPDNRVVAFPPSGSQKPAIFTPSTETWVLDAYNSGSRDGGVLAYLGSGKVLVSGGYGRSTAELYVPGVAPVATGSMSVRRGSGGSTNGFVHLDKGAPTEKVIVYGGSPDGNPPGATTAEEYSVATGTWAVRPTVMTTGRFGHSVTNLGDGTVILIGGRGPWVNTAVIHDLAADTYTNVTSTMPNPRADHAVIRLSTNKLLIFGGTIAAYTETLTTTLYDIPTKTFTAGPTMRAARQQFPVVPYGTGKWLVIGGMNGSTALTSTEIFDEATMTFTDGPVLAFGNGRQGAATLPDGRIMTGGGISSSYNDKYQILVPDPKTCASGGECSTGFCVDGYC